MALYSYGCIYLLRWSIVYALTIAAFVVGVVFAVPAGAAEEWPSMALWISLGLASLLLLILSHMPGPRVVARAVHGYLPLWLCRRGNHRFPRNEAELKEALAAYPKATLVGSGWSFFLKRTSVPSACIFTHRMRDGLVSDETKKAEGIDIGATHVWHACTKLSKVMDHYKKKGQALPSAPAIDDVTLGAWFATGSHGSAGPKALELTLVADAAAKNLPRTHAKFKAVWLYCNSKTQGDPILYPGDTLQGAKTEIQTGLDPNNKTYAILYVQLQIVNDVNVRMEAYDLHLDSNASQPDARPLLSDESTGNQDRQDDSRGPTDRTVDEWWLETNAVERMIFVGGRQAFYLKWIWIDGDEDKRHKDKENQHSNICIPQTWCCKPVAHVDPHVCSTTCRWFQADILTGFRNGCCSKFEEMKLWRGRSTLSYATRFVPPSILPIPSMLAVLWSNQVNFEIFYKLNNKVQSNDLRTIIRGLHNIHKELSGRSEIRYAGHWYSFMIDVWVAESKVEAYVNGIEILMESYTKTSVKLHRGKYSTLTLKERVEGVKSTSSNGNANALPSFVQLSPSLSNPTANV